MTTNRLYDDPEDRAAEAVEEAGDKAEERVADAAEKEAGR